MKECIERIGEAAQIKDGYERVLHHVAGSSSGCTCGGLRNRKDMLQTPHA